MNGLCEQLLSVLVTCLTDVRSKVAGLRYTVGTRDEEKIARASEVRLRCGLSHSARLIDQSLSHAVCKLRYNEAASYK
jgi:hypothetical protein